MLRFRRGNLRKFIDAVGRSRLRSDHSTTRNALLFHDSQCAPLALSLAIPSSGRGRSCGRGGGGCKVVSERRSTSRQLGVDECRMIEVLVSRPPTDTCQQQGVDTCIRQARLTDFSNAFDWCRAPPALICNCSKAQGVKRSPRREGKRG